MSWKRIESNELVKCPQCEATHRCSTFFRVGRGRVVWLRRKATHGVAIPVTGDFHECHRCKATWEVFSLRADQASEPPGMAA